MVKEGGQRRARRQRARSHPTSSVAQRYPCTRRRQCCVYSFPLPTTYFRTLVLTFVPTSQQNANAQRPPGAGSLQNNTNVNPSLLPNYQQAAPQDTSQFFSNLDASSSKQLAALTAAGNVRRATLSQPGGTSGSFVGGIASSQHGFGPASSALGHGSPVQLHQAHTTVGLPSASTPFNMHPQGDPSLHQRQSMKMSAQNMNSQSYRSRQQGFLQSLARIMAGRNTPLPPSITGVQVPYDPATSPWKGLEPASEIGGFRLAGKDVDLFLLYGLVHQAGGANKVQQQNAWASLLPQFGLPETLPHPQENGDLSTARAIARYYALLLSPFEEAYLTNLKEAQRHNAMQGRPPQGFSGQPNGMTGSGMPGTQFPVQGSNVAGSHYQAQAIPQTPQLRSNSGMMGMMSSSHHGHSMSPPGSAAAGAAQNQLTSGPEVTGPSFPTGSTDLDMDMDSRKRKVNEFEELNSKRSRRKTGASYIPVGLFTQTNGMMNLALADSEPPVTSSVYT